MSRRAKALLMGIIAVIVVVILIAAYFASQPEVNWWTPEKVLGKEEVREINNPSLEITRVNKNESYIEPLNISGGNFSSNSNFKVGTSLYLKYYTFIKGDYDTVSGNLTAWAERVSGDYILEKLVIEYSYGSEEEKEYAQVKYASLDYFWSANLWYDGSSAPYGLKKVDYDWEYNHRVEGINRDAMDKDFYGMSFPIIIFLEDTISQNLTYTITFTVTAYYGHPSLLGWTDMHELKTQVVLKIVPGGEKE